MTDQELDRQLRRVLLDSMKLGEEQAEDAAFTPSTRHQRQMKDMLSDPLKWERRRKHPVWKKWLRRTAVILLAAAVGLGALLAFSPSARAEILRWVVIWGDTRITFQHAGEQLREGTMQPYAFAELPEGYVETVRVDFPDSGSVCTYTRICYENEDHVEMSLAYMYMEEGSLLAFETEGADIFPVTVNGLEGALFMAQDPGRADNSITWIDPEMNMQFIVNGFFDADEMLRLAESVVPVFPDG